MNPIRWTTLLVMALALGLVAPCCDDGGPDGDADGDADGDGDGDGDADGDAPDCPWNSGWPCTCNRLEPCDDGSTCALVAEATEGRRLCTALCDLTQPDRLICPDTSRFPGSLGMCFLQASPYGDPDHCLLGCMVESACPSDQRCVDLGISEEMNFCVP
jgi:hypothetical protein